MLRSSLQTPSLQHIHAKSLSHRSSCPIPRRPSVLSVRNGCKQCLQSFKTATPPVSFGQQLRRQQPECRPLRAFSAAAGGSADPIRLTEPVAEPVKGKSIGKLALRIIFGIILISLGVVVILSGGWLYTAVACLVSYQASQEYYGFITSIGVSSGVKPPPKLVSAVTTITCIGLTFWTYASHGRSTAALAVASLIVLSLQLLAVEKPRFSQLTSSVFGLFYCGYLPSFWIKLRLMGAPALNSTVVHGWPVMLGGIAHWSVGLIATMIAVLCIAAADTGAYIFGKSFGKTRLMKISPGKTVEGAIGGLVCSVATALGAWKVLAWPATPFGAAVLGVVIFLSSLFGDLIESVMKRDAGMKDAGNLIPGHGGLLDRFDSYIFTGAVVFFLIRFLFPMFGL